jgi:thiol-disulfide isomerase/thioredoxin
VSGGAWIASYVVLWITVVILGLAVVALLRQVGVLHARLRPLGVHFGGEGPELRTPAPEPARFGYHQRDLTLVAFTSPTCEICASLMPGLRAIEQEYAEVGLHQVDHAPATATVFAAFDVRSTPYVVAVDRRGVVRGRGIANSLEQVEELIAEALAEAAEGSSGDTGSREERR